MKKEFIVLLLMSMCLVIMPVTAQELRNRNFWITRYMSVSYPLKRVVINSTYGMRKDPWTGLRVMHNGLDLEARYETVYSMLDGVVEAKGEDSRSGRYIIVCHGEYTVSYCHLSKSYVNKGDTVYAGEPIAVSGNTGRSTGPHLHLTCRHKGKSCNPHDLLLYIKDVRKECYLALGGRENLTEPLSCSDFISRYAAMAMDHQRRYGIPASVTLAQMALESDWGQSELAVKGNNYFGIKANKRWLEEGRPYSLHNDERPNEKFCNYSSVQESIEHHSQLITNKYYKRYCSYSPTDYHSWLRGLIRAGYASAKNYVASCEKIIKKYKLHEYDLQAKKTM